MTAELQETRAAAALQTRLVGKAPEALEKVPLDEGPATHDDRLVALEKSLEKTSKETAALSESKSREIAQLAQRLMDLTAEVGRAKELLDHASTDQELNKISDHLAMVMDVLTSTEQALGAKADTEAVAEVRAQLDDFHSRSSEALAAVEAQGEKKVEEVRADLMEQLRKELEALMRRLPKPDEKGPGGALQGFSFQAACLSCNQQLPRNAPRFPRMMAPPQVPFSSELLS